MNRMKVKDLREIAKSRGLKGYSRLRKSELISLIMSEEERHKNDEIERRRQERLRKVTAEAKIKAEKKSKSKARRQAKREESRREAERRVEVKRVESNQRKQRQENIAGERPTEKETKSQRKRRQRLERQARQVETQRKAHEKAQKKNPKKNRKEKKRQHRATKKARRKAKISQRLREPAQPELVSNAIEGNVQRWFISGEGYVDPSAFLDHTEDGVREVVDRVSGPKKVYTVLKCVLMKNNLKTGERVFSDFNGHSRTHTITTELGDTYEEMKGKMLESLAKYQKEGSGWRLYSVKGLDVSIVKFNPLDGSGHSKLPFLVAKKKAVINMKNSDDQCFKWAVTRALNPVKRDSERITKELRKQAEEFNWKDITFPMKVKDIPIWEKNNDKFVNVFGYDEESGKIYPIKLCDNNISIVLGDNETQDDKFVNLFLHDDNHYCV